MKFKEHVKYEDEEWVVINEFLSGNGTYDILMITIKNIKNDKEITVAEMDVTHITPF